MVKRIRTAEDHNDTGLQVAPLPARYTRYTSADFVAGAKTHNLIEDTPLIWIMLTSDENELLLPTVEGNGTWRLPSGMIWPISALGRRDVSMTLSATADATVEIWEF